MAKKSGSTSTEKKSTGSKQTATKNNSGKNTSKNTGNTITPVVTNKDIKQNESDRQSALSELDSTYDSIANSADDAYQSQIALAGAYSAQQQKLQQERTDFAIEQIEQQKKQAEEDYQKEQSGAYVDWQKESNRYGANAEQAASNGLSNTGYSESSQVSMYNTYQNRVATARESFNRAILNYDNAIKDAQLQNNSALAEIAYNALKQQAELALQQVQYKNQLLLDQVSKRFEIESLYDNRWKILLDKISDQNSLAEQRRQFNKSFAYQEKRDAISDKQRDEEFAFQKEQFEWKKEQAGKSSSSSRSSSGSGGSSKKTYKTKKSDGKDLPLIEQDNDDDSRQNAADLAKKIFAAGDVGTEVKKEQEKKAQKAIKKLMNSTYQKVGAKTKAEMKAKKEAAKNSNVTTDYYNGNINEDAYQYGALSNGYQPAGISGYGQVQKTGEYTYVTVVDINTGKRVSKKQNVWKTKDGKKWYWDGNANRYRPVQMLK